MEYQAISQALPTARPGQSRCFAFSVHKSGSTMLTHMVMDVCAAADIPSVSLPNVFFAEGIPPQTWRADPAVAPMFDHNLIYFGFRFMPKVLENEVPGFRDDPFVLLIRDPRDALVSEYFSYGKKGGSHVVPAKNAEEITASLKNRVEQPIDQYVLRQAPALKAKLDQYRTVLNFDNGLVRRYEDVFFDKHSFLREIFEHFGIDVPADVIASVAAKHDIRPESEDETKHIRKGTPGDHAEKLAPETIAELNDIFRDVGAFYGYEF